MAERKARPIPLKPLPAADPEAWVNGPSAKAPRPGSRVRRSRVGLRLQKITVQIPYELYRRLGRQVFEQETTERELVERLLEAGLTALEQRGTP